MRSSKPKDVGDEHISFFCLDTDFFLYLFLVNRLLLVMMRFTTAKHSVLGIAYFFYSPYLCTAIQITHRKDITIIKKE